MKAIAFAMFLLASQNAFAALLGTERDWAFIQSVGGIAIGEPKLENNRWVLPVLCDVTGLKTITTKPTTLNSGLVWADTKARIEGNIIYLSIETAVVGMSGKSSACGPAKLGKLKPGKYEVMYLSANKSTHPIGALEIGL
jgi:hypothetical protein